MWNIAIHAELTHGYEIILDHLSPIPHSIFPHEALFLIQTHSQSHRVKWGREVTFIQTQNGLRQVVMMGT